MVVKMDKRLPANEKRSTWLESNLGHNKTWHRWTWCFGMFMLAAVIGGCVAIWWFTRSNPAHAIPVAIGGGGSETMGPLATIATPVGADMTSALAAEGSSAAATTTKEKTKAKRTVGDFVLPLPTESPGKVTRMHKRALRRGLAL